MKTVHLLLQNEALRSEERRTAKENKTEETEEEKDRFGPTMLKLVKAEAHGSKSYKKIVAIVDVLIDLTAEIKWSGADDEDKAYFDEVLTFAFALLGHPFPKVRKYVAEQLYVAILENEGVVKDDSKYDNACSVILETAWDGELEQTEEQEVAVRVRRNELADLMGVELSEKARAKKVVKKGKEKEKKDELASYMSLVKEAGR
ncbi:hypothetical protein TL16_g01338 [Triparma laevis f. inornata]|uniref:Uncharacterized protein n=1 Tax=Triparma laevis f. inornata TaxID=1714386 RepID=A0A9W6ZKF3_9STRA|nr:hypothetical protein TL16_g01338 [Triparma laevis f. inornata]